MAVDARTHILSTSCTIIFTDSHTVMEDERGKAVLSHIKRPLKFTPIRFLRTARTLPCLLRYILARQTGTRLRGLNVEGYKTAVVWIAYNTMMLMLYCFSRELPQNSRSFLDTEVDGF